MKITSNTALLLIDLQNDYYPQGLFPLANTEAVTQQIIQLIDKVTAAGGHPIHVQHIADPAQGLAPFFNAGSEGAQIHPSILAAAPNAPIIVKHYADSFVKTNLAQTLNELNIKQLLVCGMMTQNCVTHTAISPDASAYAEVAIVSDCCTTQSEILHLIALHAVSTRITLLNSAELN